MRHRDFRIGLDFITATGRWRCTDISRRVIVAIPLDAPDTSWYNGPPYAVSEAVFDEDGIQDWSVAPVASVQVRE